MTHVSALLGVSVVAWLPALAVAGFLILLLVIKLADKRLTSPYVPVPDHVAAQLDLPPYVRAMCGDAQAAGLVFGGLYAHAEYPSIRALGAFWTSPDRHVLAITGSGTVLRMPVRQTWLVTPLASGRYLVTTDQNDEGDPSGLLAVRRKIGFDLHRLLAVHERRCRGRWDAVRAFPEPSPFDSAVGLHAHRARTLVERGRARWIVPDGSAWRYTLSGGVHIWLSFGTQFAGALTQFWRVIAPGSHDAVGPAHDAQVDAVFAALAAERGMAAQPR